MSDDEGHACEGGTTMPTTPAQTHTPGPWTAAYDDTDPSRCGYLVRKRSNVPVAFVSSANPNEQRERIARLIAAAPELLEALKHAAHDLESRLYLLPLDADETERAILEAQQRIYGRAIATAEGQP